MSNKIFTHDEIATLSNNKYVKRVSARGITYTDEFKRIFSSENEKGKLPRVPLALIVIFTVQVAY